MEIDLENERELRSHYEHFVEDSGNSGAFKAQFEGNVAEFIARQKQEKQKKLGIVEKENEINEQAEPEDPEKSENQEEELSKKEIRSPKLRNQWSLEKIITI